MSVDYVLVHNTPSKSSKCVTEKQSIEKRSIFEAGLVSKGLRLEKQIDGCLTFIKISAPKQILRRYCEILKMRMPIKEIEDAQEEIQMESCSTFIKMFFRLDPRNTNKVDKPVLLAEYSRDKSYLFDENSPEFFAPTVRILVVDFILNRQKWCNEKSKNTDGVGIQYLLDQKVYNSAYPLHDGHYEISGSMRHWLFVHWGRMNKWKSYQPVDKIKQYLGVEYAFYFAWLGFYNHLLIIASGVGILVLLYGYITMEGDNFSQEICNNSTDVVMCPLCNSICDYWNLSDSCLYAKVSHLLDNSFTVAFAFFMSVWGTVFLELWKRYSAALTHSWGLTGYTVQAEYPRPKYLAKLSSTRHRKVNVITGQSEPTVPFWSVKLPITIFSYTVIIFFVLVAVGAVFSVVLYRMWMMKSFKAFDRFGWFTQHSSIVTSCTGATLNLICIMILNYLYGTVAVYLTDMELPRTQTEYEHSLTIKIYLFQFVNYYTSIIYMAFFKGKYVGYPGNYNTIFGLRQEECSSSGCLMDLTFQLAFIMIGKQILNAAMEMGFPIAKKLLNGYSVQKQRLKENNFNLHELLAKRDVPEKQQWFDDYKLLDWNNCGLFTEYLEMVIQFGFVTLFVSAFPLAPLFALLNNVFELRLDAQKLLKYYRRPVPRLVANIGVWYRILDVIGKLAVITNALIIAFSTTFIPRLVYKYGEHGGNATDVGYLKNSLSYFDILDFSTATAPLYSTYNVSYCRYTGYRTPPWSYEKYQRTTFYWQVLIARIVFVLIFQNVVHTVKVGIQWLIPDVSEKLSDLMKKEAHLTTQLIIKREKNCMKHAREQSEDEECLRYIDDRSFSSDVNV